VPDFLKTAHARASLANDKINSPPAGKNQPATRYPSAYPQLSSPAWPSVSL
jgi:hypothetical protein